MEKKNREESEPLHLKKGQNATMEEKKNDQNFTFKMARSKGHPPERGPQHRHKRFA